jgi:hypothetical protein
MTLNIISGSMGDIKVKVKLPLFFNCASHHESVLGSGGITPLIL